MQSGFKIFKIFGIDIRIDWSWLIILGLVTWNLSAVFGQAHPDWDALMRWGIAFVAAILFFASVLAHELAHSLVARATGVPVHNITLFLFGGVSNIQRDPPSPGAEFLIAVVGPITSIVLGVVFFILSGVSMPQVNVENITPGEIVAGLGPLPTLLLWLGPVNVLVGLFNLIPGFPLDGGRILRSIFWGITNNLRKATRWASWVGRGVAYLMIGSGIVMIFGVQIPILGTGFINGLWLIFIGWFLNNAALQSYRRMMIQDVLEGVTVQRMMRRDIPTVNDGIRVDELVHTHIMNSDDYAFPVLEGNNLAGIVTLDDVRKVPREDWPQTTVKSIMTPFEKLTLTSPDEEAAEAFNKLTTSDFRQLPVVSGKELLGLLRRRDIMRWLRLESEAEL